MDNASQAKLHAAKQTLFAIKGTPKAGGEPFLSFRTEEAAFLPLHVWSGHSCPLPLTLLLI